MSTAIDWLAAGLIVPLVINWLTFAVLFVTARRNRGIRALIYVRWLSLVIALSSTAFALLGITYFVHLTIDGLTFSLLLTVPLYAMTAVNGVFLYLTWRGKW